MGGNPLVDNAACGKTFKFVIESMQAGVEKHYYWILRFLQQPGPFGLGFEQVLKLRDVFDAAASSSFFGNIEQRRSIQQGEVGKWLGALAQMNQSLFKMIHELRILDERLTLYEEDEKGIHESQLALKTVWTNLVEGGTQNPGSVLGLSAVGGPGYVTLADHFFNTDVKSSEDVASKVKAIDTNQKVKSLVATKLKQFAVWRDTTKKELRQRKRFSLSNLKTHYYTMKMYINWIRPYITNIRALNLKGDLNDPDIVRSFESAKIELELLAFNSKSFHTYYPAVRVTMKYVVLPQMAFQSEYQKGPMHMGRTDVVIAPYVVTQKDIDEYFKKKDEEDFEVLKSLQEGFTAIEDDLKEYLKQADMIGGKKEKEDKKESASFFTGFFTSLGSTFGLKELRQLGKENKAHQLKPIDAKSEKSKAGKAASGSAYALGYIFKKANRMVTM